MGCPKLSTEDFQAVLEISFPSKQNILGLAKAAFTLPSYAVKEYMSKSQHIKDKVKHSTSSFMQNLETFFFNLPYY